MKKQKECIINPDGKFGILTPEETVENYLNLIKNTKSEVIILNLSNVSFIDSLGISIMIRMHKLCKKNNKYFSVTNCKTVVKNLLYILKLDREIPIS